MPGAFLLVQSFGIGIPAMRLSDFFLAVFFYRIKFAEN